MTDTRPRVQGKPPIVHLRAVWLEYVTEHHAAGWTTVEVVDNGKTAYHIMELTS